MRRTILLASVLPFVSAFLGEVLAFGLLNAPPVTAQFSQPAEVRTSALEWVARPIERADTHLLRGFTREAGRGEVVPVRPPAIWPLWVQVVEPTPLYSEGGVQLGLAVEGDWYRLVWQEEGWVQGVAESEPQGEPLWLTLDSRVQVALE